MIVYGINPVVEALRAGRVRRLLVAAETEDRRRSMAREDSSHQPPDPRRRSGDGERRRGSRRRDRRIDEAIAIAREMRLPIERVDERSLDRAARGGVHQGIAADLEPERDYRIDEIVAAASPDAALLVVLDGIEDPHNVGAILRTADAAGCHGLVRQARHAASLSGIVAKASAGAIAHVRVATVVNIARAVDELKELGVWTVGLDSGAEASYYEIDLTLPTAIVLGAEGAGLRRLVRDRCDRVASIPMHGSVDSLNVSVAAGVALYEAVRQRSQTGANASKRGNSRPGQAAAGDRGPAGSGAAG